MSGSEEIFQKAMDQGHSAAWDESWEQAAGFYRQALEEFIDHPAALTSLGLALFQLADFDEALRCYIKAARLTPEDPVPVEKIAQLYERIGIPERARAAGLQAAELFMKNREVTKAIESWSHVAELYPENLVAHSRLAQVNERLNKPDEAVSEYLTLAALYQRANDMEKAQSAVQHALEILPSSGLAANALALLRQHKALPMQGKSSPVATPTRSRTPQLTPPKTGHLIQQLDPVDEARQLALFTLASLLFETPDEESASPADFQSIVHAGGSHTPNIDATRIMLHLGQVVELQTRGDFKQAVIELEHAIEAGLEHPAAYYDLGYLSLRVEDHEKAARSLQIAVQSSEYTLGSRLLLGQIYQKINQYRQSAVEYLHALSHADAASVPEQYSEMLMNLYEPLIEAQNLETDVSVQRQVSDNITGLLMQPGWREHIRQAREQLPTQSDGGPPVPLAEILTQSRSSQIVESLSTIYQLDRAGYLRSAMEEAFYALEYAPTYLPLHVMMGELLLKQGQMNEAIAKFLAVAQSFSSRGEAQRAISLYRRVLDQAPLALEPRERLVALLTSSGQVEEAINEYIEFAEVYYSLADLEKARKTYITAMGLARKSGVDPFWQVRILHRVADIDQQSLNYKEAIRVYEQIRNLKPDDEKARQQLIQLQIRIAHEASGLAELDNYLGYLGTIKESAKALAFLEGLLKEDPLRIGLLRRVVERYYKAGRVEDALALLDSAGDQLIQAGNVADAIQVIEMILALEPPKAKQYEQLLAQLRGAI